MDIYTCVGVVMAGRVIGTSVKILDPRFHGVAAQKVEIASCWSASAMLEEKDMIRFVNPNHHLLFGLITFDKKERVHAIPMLVRRYTMAHLMLVLRMLLF